MKLKTKVLHPEGNKPFPSTVRKKMADVHFPTIPCETITANWHITRPTASPAKYRAIFRAISQGNYSIEGTMSDGAHAQLSPVETNLHTTRRGIFAFPPLQKLSKI